MLLNQKTSHYFSGNTGPGLEPEPKLLTKVELEPKINNFGSATLRKNIFFQDFESSKKCEKIEFFQIVLNSETLLYKRYESR